MVVRVVRLYMWVMVIRMIGYRACGFLVEKFWMKGLCFGVGCGKRLWTKLLRALVGWDGFAYCA